MSTNPNKKPSVKTLKVIGDPSHPAPLATLAADPLVRNAVTSSTFITNFGEVDLTESIAVLKQRVAAVHADDLTSVERTLIAQADALDAIFTQLAQRAAANMGQYINATETYLKLALKAQSQCRATLETLAEIKRPTLVIAKQANIAHGHQQVNNGEVARGEIQTKQNELLEHDNEKSWLDAGTAKEAGRGDKSLATVGTIDRATQRRRKGQNQP